MVVRWRIIMTLEQFEKDLTEKLANMSDEELMNCLIRAGFKFPDEDNSDEDYKNSLKNDY